MIVINRFQVPPTEEAAFVSRARAALDLLSSRRGWRDGELARNVDEPQLWTLVTRWDGVGHYRRALGGYDAKVTVVPLLSLAVDEPSAYLGIDELEADQLGG